MKRFKLGFTLMTLGGCLLFGMAPRSAEASGSLDTGEAAATFEATFENGLLHVVLPKGEEARPRRIAVKAE